MKNMNNNAPMNEGGGTTYKGWDEDITIFNSVNWRVFVHDKEWNLLVEDKITTKHESRDEVMESLKRSKISKHTMRSGDKLSIVAIEMDGKSIPSAKYTVMINGEKDVFFANKGSFQAQIKKQLESRGYSIPETQVSMNIVKVETL